MQSCILAVLIMIVLIAVITEALMAAGAPAVKITSIPGQNPSGEPMPVGDLPGWHQTLAEDFNGALNTNVWELYSGDPGNGGYWAGSHVTTSSGMLVIKGYQDATYGNKWTSGGIAPLTAQTYGKWAVRFRMDPGKGLSYAMLLWPRPASWPWEIDFAEDNATNKQITSATLHYPSSSGSEVQDERRIQVDSTQWHTFGVEWTPSSITCILDGQVWTQYTNHIPTMPMHVAIQDQAWCCGSVGWPCPDSSTPKEVDLQVDWIVQYSKA
jgi:beta-glucanase (GH16 family)